MSQRSPEEILKILEDQAFEDEIRDVAAMRDGDLDEALRAAGIDPKTAHASGRDMAARAMRASSQQSLGGEGWVRPPPAPPRRALSPPWSTLLVASLSAAVAGGTMYALARRHHDENPIVMTPDGSSKKEAKALAQRIRGHALESCHESQWQDCADGLTAARALDPEGDADPRVQAAWQSAQGALAKPQEPETVPRDLKEDPRDLKESPPPSARDPK
jgi:hypothetical protein